jgi:hypothetical protein
VNCPVPLSIIPKQPSTLFSSKYFFKSLLIVTLLGEQPIIITIRKIKPVAKSLIGMQIFAKVSKDSKTPSNSPKGRTQSFILQILHKIKIKKTAALDSLLESFLFYNLYVKTILVLIVLYSLAISFGGRA